VRLAILTAAISTGYVVYICLPFSHFQNGLPYSHLFLTDIQLRWSDWIFLPHAVATMLGAYSLWLPKDHPGPFRFTVLAWVASLPVSLLYGYGLRALGRRLRNRLRSN
jgi:hypothetical protein